MDTKMVSDRTTNQETWDAYNELLIGPDTERLRKILARAELFCRVLVVPGDIVECGVFKGAGLLLWLKLLAIHCPGSNKRVVGFDTFGKVPEGTLVADKQAVAGFTAEAGESAASCESIMEAVRRAALPEDRCDLVSGDVTITAAEYVRSNPGFRISLLNLDLDLEEPTLAALSALWNVVVPGGIVIFDQYAIPRWSESNAVDEFFRERHVRLQTLTWARTPSAYVFKEAASGL